MQNYWTTNCKTEHFAPNKQRFSPAFVLAAALLFSSERSPLRLERRYLVRHFAQLLSHFGSSENAHCIGPNIVSIPMIDLDDLAEAKGLDFSELLDEIEAIVYSGTKA